MDNNILNQNFISKLKFKGIWRSYQQRVLDELDFYLDDKKLNIVAAPGAGKTTLGIEVILRLKNNAIIFTPTITIKNQWKQRIIEGFLQDTDNCDDISTDIDEIRPITVTTYQALHSICKDENAKKQLIKNLKKNNIKTVVLDEAHHLRTEWYSTLKSICKILENEDFKIVSLTGTPPYDVSQSEWNNYLELCGSIDEEISIPELVKSGDLCPHQDLIYFSDLTSQEEKLVFDFQKSLSDFFDYIEKSPDLLYSVNSSAFVNDIDTNSEIIFQNTAFTISVISYLLNNDDTNMQAGILCNFLDLTREQIPKFDYQIAQTLINGILGEFEKYFNNVINIKAKLKDLKLLKGSRVDFSGKTDFKKLLARSVNKLEAIEKITKTEYSELNKNLKEVILLDYIGQGDSAGLNIISVFDKLYPLEINMGILTGTLVVIPKSSKDKLYKILEENNIDKEKVLCTDFKENYLRVETYGDVNIVLHITSLFEKGYINILIGTAALLGEGWDSPCINTLIIASVVGSYMLSNQMRGRALRIDKNNKNKTANIWHLVSLSNYSDNPQEFDDYSIITKRFSTFEGISYNENKIQNGIGRLNLNFKTNAKSTSNYLNNKMMTYAKDRINLEKKWNDAFSLANKLMKNISPQVYEIVNSNFDYDIQDEEFDFWRKMTSGFIKQYKINFSKEIQLALAKCILKTLCDIGIIKTPYNEIQIKSDFDKENHTLSMTVLNCHNNERYAFIKSYSEIFRFSDNLRYILKLKVDKKDKYIPVPELIGQKQEFVKIFQKNITENILLKEYLTPFYINDGKLMFSLERINITQEFILLASFGVILSFLLHLANLNMENSFIQIYVLLSFLYLLSIKISKGYFNFKDKNKNTEIIFTKTPKNQKELIKAKYNAYISADVSNARAWL